MTITTPADGGEYANSTTVAADWSVSDALSGIDTSSATTPNGDPIDTSGLGSKSYSVSATDLAGNSSSVTHNYEVTRLVVAIDIKPGSDPNSINLGSKGVIPVGVFSGNYSGVELDATTIVDETLVFEGTGIAHKGTHDEDLDGAGGLDNVSHYRTQETSLTEASVEGCLVGETSGGILFTGCDSVRIVPPNNSNAGGGGGGPSASNAGGNGKGKGKK